METETGRTGITSVLALWVFAVGTAVVTTWVGSGATGSDRATAGFILGLMATWLINQQAVRRTRRWGTGRRSPEQGEHGDFDWSRRDSNVGVWRGAGPGESFTVWWLPEDEHGYFMFQGWVNERTEIKHAVVWDDAETLRQQIEFAEARDLYPDDDLGTRGMRARLGVYGWDSELV